METFSRCLVLILVSVFDLVSDFGTICLCFSKGREKGGENGWRGEEDYLRKVTFFGEENIVAG